MTERSSLHRFLLVLGVLIAAPTRSDGESSTCLTVYKEGGAPAVFKSPKCPRWKHSDHTSRSTARCQSAMLQGRRKSMEDRTLCALDLRIPFPGKGGIKEVKVGVVAVFDGHNGAEASDMASKLLLEYFVLHTYFLIDASYSALLKKGSGSLETSEKHYRLSLRNDLLDGHELNLGRFKHSIQADSDDSFHFEILKEALLRAIHDIDAKFTKEASSKKIDSGSTATVALLADGQILVANVGDSKAFLCSENFRSAAQAKAAYLRLYRQERSNGAVSRVRNHGNFRSTPSSGLVHFSVKELTRDHHPDRDDEKVRVETSGGYVREWGGVHRVNGELAISRAIGDVSFKSYGVISAPELTDWQALTENDTYLVAASDGVFEKLSLQDVCDLLWDVRSYTPGRSELSSSCAYSLADCIVDTAFGKGSMDNVAAVVVPLVSTGLSENLFPELSVREGDITRAALVMQKSSLEGSGNKFTHDLQQLDYAHPVNAKFERLLVEGKNGSIGCFYLSENLDEHAEYMPQAMDDHEDYLYDLRHLRQALPVPLDDHFGGPLNLYYNQNFCMDLGITVDNAKDQCINSEGFASFLALLKSIPLQDAGPNNESYEYSVPDKRYVLKKRFGRGSYGEVWLAFNWKCDQCSNFSDSSSPDENMFILKRIMVERGAAVYLSGLREKYFGEAFLNASNCLGGPISAGASNSVLNESFNFYGLVERNDSMEDEIGNSWTTEGVFRNKFSGLYEEGLNHIARYVESFESRSNEIWLVFRYEGTSLSKLMYTAEEDTADGKRDEKVRHVQIVRPSKWWHWLKTTKAGQEQMRSLIWQLLMALKSCHDRNITHRDIKPENMVLCSEEQGTGRCLRGTSHGENFTTKMRVIDFGSAMDEFTLKHLYGSTGPSRAEQTNEYTPPEALLCANWYQRPTNTTLKYDMWSVGVVILELILGSPNVFEITGYTRALLDQHLEGWNEGLKELAYKLRSLMELCILIPGSISPHHHTVDRAGASPASWKCSEEFFSHQIRIRDPLKLGFPNIWALRLVRQLLLWDPDERLSVDEALQHPYFQHPPTE